MADISRLLAALRQLQGGVKDYDKFGFGKVPSRADMAYLDDESPVRAGTNLSPSDREGLASGAAYESQRDLSGKILPGSSDFSRKYMTDSYMKDPDAAAYELEMRKKARMRNSFQPMAEQ